MNQTRFCKFCRNGAVPWIALGSGGMASSRAPGCPFSVCASGREGRKVKREALDKGLGLDFGALLLLCAWLVGYWQVRCFVHLQNLGCERFHKYFVSGHFGL